MGWNSPTFHATGDVITAADYNHRYYNERYLKGLDGDITLSDHIVGDAKNKFVDGVGSHTHLSAGAEGGVLNILATVAGTTPTRVIDTIYQNLTGKLLLVTTSVELESTEIVYVYMASTSPPGLVWAKLRGGGAGQEVIPVTFIVPVNWYYKIGAIAGTPTIFMTSEWALY